MDSAAAPHQLLPSEIRYESGGAVEEIFNSLTHAIGAGLSIAGLVVLILLTNRNPDPWRYVSFTIYGTSQIMLFLSSAVMHSFAALPRVRHYLRIIDQAFIFLLIAGTYTPMTLIAMRGNGGWVVFGVIWTIALIGIVLKVAVFRRPHIASDLLYLAMGWVIVFAFRRVSEVVPRGFIVSMIIGGVTYTLGVLFYALKRVPFSHVIWHIFVLGGSISFFLGYAVYVA